MQKGSLIVYIAIPTSKDIELSNLRNHAIPVKGDIYTCSGIGKGYNGTDILGVEELNNGVMAYKASAFAEIAPPIDINAILEESIGKYSLVELQEYI